MKQEQNNNIKKIVKKDYPLRNTVVFVFSIPMLLLFASLITTPLILILKVKGNDLFIPGLFGTVFAEISVIIWGLWYTDELSKWKEYLSLRVPPKKAIVAGAAAGLGLFGMLQLCALALGHFGIQIESSDTSNSLTSLSGITKIFILIFMASFIVPIVEEFLFRGLIYKAVFKSNIPQKYKTISAFFVTSLLFSLAHFQGLSEATDIFLLIWIFFTASILFFFRHKFNSIYVSIAIHIVYNFSPSVLSLIPGLQ